MNKRIPRLYQIVLLSFLAAFIGPVAFGDEAPKNIILLVGDGMGPEQIKAAGLFAFGKTGTLSFESLPAKAQVITASASPKVTDSAAAATAMAAGQKVLNGVLSVRLPGDEQPLPTVLEYYQKQGKRTGLVTSSYIYDATPAAFAAHVKSRQTGGQISQQMLAAKVNVLFGGAAETAEEGMTPDMARAAGYQVATDRQQMFAFKAAKDKYFSGQFGLEHMPLEYDYSIRVDRGYDRWPHLSEMAVKALELLDNEKGFFAMIEGGSIDTACHSNDIQGAIYETLEFSSTVRTVLDWAQGRKDTLIVVLADHETGGLSVLEGRGRGQWPLVKFSTTGHSPVNIRLFAKGPGSEKISGVIDNTDVYRILMGRFEASSATQPAATQPSARPAAEAMTPAAK